MAIAWGIKRRIYSNEAGEGTAPHAAAAAEVTHPVKQGLVQAFSDSWEFTARLLGHRLYDPVFRKIQCGQSEWWISCGDSSRVSPSVRPLPRRL